MISLFSSTTVSLALAEGEGGFNPLEFTPGAAFWTVVIFALALVPMWKFVFGPITKALDERDRKVDDAIAAAEKARREAEEQVAVTKSELEKARREAREMVAEATARAEKQAAEELAKAKAEADRQIKQATADIDAMRRRALEDIRREVVDLSIASAGQILQRDVDDAAHRQFVDQFVQKAGGASA